MDKYYSQWLLPLIKKAIKEHKLINEGDRIAVAVSGGKDSTVLLFLMQLLRKQLGISFSLKAIYVDLGWQTNITPLANYCIANDISLHVEKTVIAQIVFDYRQEKNPCSLCSKLRNGALNKAALTLGCNKVALGHHLDDLVETFFLSLFYAAQMRTFAPRTHLNQTGIVLIRPLIYITQQSVETVVAREHLPVHPNQCPVSGKTKREEVKSVVAYLATLYPDFKQKLATALKNLDPQQLWPNPPF